LGVQPALPWERKARPALPWERKAARSVVRPRPAAQPVLVQQQEKVQSERQAAAC